MFNNLTERLERSFKILKGQGRITEINISETTKDIRKALVAADVNYNVAKAFVDRVKQEAIGQKVINALKPKELMLKIVHDELVKLMGEETVPLNADGHPAVILMSGLQGAGKTTFAAKIAKLLKEKKGKRPLLVGADVYRPAAREQLRVNGEKVGVPMFTREDSKDPIAIAREAIAYAKSENYNVVIVDTAGRLAVDEEMMQEIENIKNAINPQETLFVVDATTGQDAVNTAKAFNDRIDFDGVVLTKLDGDTKGGAAISIRAVVTKPIKYIGTGEGMEGIQVFDPRGMASRILGGGDVQELVNRINSAISEDEAKRIETRIKTNKFDFDDFLSQIQKIKSMGKLTDLIGMIPGMSKMTKGLDNVDLDGNAFKSIEAIIGSMTPYERKHPDCIKGSRRQRIAKGSGTKLEEVNRLLKQFEDMRKMMHKVSNMSPTQMMKQVRQAKRARR